MTESQRISRLYEKQHRIYEKRIYPIFLSAIRLQVQPVIDWIGKMQDVDPPLDILVSDTIFRKPIKTAYELVGIMAAKREYYYMKGVEEKGVIEFLINQWRAIFSDYATTYAYRIENDLTETTKDEIRLALKYAYEQNLNADQTAALIKKSVQGIISRNRAIVIARTEATTASNLGKITGAKEWLKETGQEGYKQWIGRSDNRERHAHIQMNDDIIPIDSQWKLTDPNGLVSHCDAPGDVLLPGNQRIQCRCTQLFMSARRYSRLAK